MITKKSAVVLIIIFVVIGVSFSLFYVTVKNEQRDMEIMKLGMENDPKQLMMSGNMSIQDYCDHFYFDDPTFCDAWKK